MTGASHRGPRPLDGAAALVTGGSSGIGLGLAHLVAELGADVTLVARGADRLEVAAEELRREGCQVRTVAADVGRLDEVQRAVADHQQAFGRLDVLINSAGLALPSKPARQDPAKVAAMLAVDLGAVVHSYAAAIDLLLAAASERGQARVVNVASITARAAQPWLSVYSATKAAVLSYVSAMNQAFAASGVVSTALCPGFVDTPMSQDARNLTPDQMITVSDVVEAARPLFGLSRASYIAEVVIARTMSKDPSGL